MKFTKTKTSYESQFERTGPSVQDVIRKDPIAPPKDVTESHPRDFGVADIDRSRYFEQSFHEREMQRMWTRVWQMAGREEEIPSVGDILTYEIGSTSVIVVRVTESEIKAYYNTCLHRGVKLCAGNTHLTKLRCPFHGFTWSLDGSLEYIPCRWDFPQVTSENFRLPEVQLGRWGGFIFINLDPDAAPLEDYIEVFPEHFQGVADCERKWMAAAYRKIVPCNWKVAVEAFMEAYHVLETHPQGLPTTTDANTQYDIFPGSRHTNRFVETIGVPSTHLEATLSEQDMIDHVYADMGVEVPTLKPGETAREALANLSREAAAAVSGRDYNGCSTAEAVDGLQYFLFPNIVIFRGLSYPVAYRFRPNGNDPNSAIFDFMILRDIPLEGQRPEAAEFVEMGDASFRDMVVELPSGLRLVYDQDIQNMGLQQEGLKAGGKPTVTLSRYQESRIRHMVETLDSYLAMPPLNGGA